MNDPLNNEYTNMQTNLCELLSLQEVLIKFSAHIQIDHKCKFNYYNQRSNIKGITLANQTFHHVLGEFTFNRKNSIFEMRAL